MIYSVKYFIDFRHGLLGHSTLEMTRRYVQLQTEDLSAVHDGLSVVAVGTGRR
jgi:hypothetical protein